MNRATDLRAVIQGPSHLFARWITVQRSMLLIALLCASCGLHAAVPTEGSDAFQELLRGARFDDALAIPDACPSDVVSRSDVEHARAKAGILRNRGDGKGWAQSLVSLKCVAESLIPRHGVGSEELNAFRAYYAAFPVEALMELPETEFLFDDNEFFIESLDRDAAGSSVDAGRADRAYLIKMESSGHSVVAMVDTGAPAALSMSGAAADKAGITEVVGLIASSSRQFGDYRPAYKEELRIAREISFGTVKIKNLLVQEDQHDRSERAVVGTGLLSRFDDVNFEEKGIGFNKERALNGKSLKYSFQGAADVSQSVFVVSGAVDGVARSIMIDTGLESFSAYVGPLAVDKFEGLDREAENGYSGMINSTFSFGGMNFIDVPVFLILKTPQDAEFDVMLGGGMRRALNFRLDFRHGDVYFWPHAQLSSGQEG